MRYILAVLVTGFLAATAVVTTTPASANPAAGVVNSAVADLGKSEGIVDEVGYRRHRGIHFSFGYGYPRYYGYHYRPYRPYYAYGYNYYPRYYYKRRWRHRHWH